LGVRRWVRDKPPLTLNLLVMSVRTAPAAPAARARGRNTLDEVLCAGFQKLGLDVEDTDMPYKRGSSGAVKSNVDALGLELKSLYFPSVREDPTTMKRLGPRLSTVTLRRANTGTAPGVVYDENATVLIISADSGYTDKYLDYLNAVRSRKATADLPDIEYSFPVPRNKQEASSYVEKAQGHLRGLITEATLESIGKSDFSNDYEQPLSKIYVFFKRPVTGSDALRSDGPYIYFGRFKAQPESRLLRNGPGGPSFTDLEMNRVKSIKLRAFDTPPAPPFNSRAQMSMPTAVTSVVEADVEVVVRLLKRLDIRGSE
jgi:hypothetical protein